MKEKATYLPVVVWSSSPLDPGCHPEEGTPPYEEA